MPRDIPVGNGSLLVTFDDRYRVRDVYWPHVGMANHTDGHVQRFGVWVDGSFAWVEDGGWERSLRYASDTMITDVTLRHEGLKIEIHCRDAVDYHSPVSFRDITVKDLAGRPRDVRLFLHNDLSIGGSPVGDTARFDPDTGGVVHYKDNTYFLFNGGDDNRSGVEHFTAGTKRLGGAEGTWRDAEDGHLSGNAIAQGSVDSTIGFDLRVPAGGEARLVTWMAAGESHADVVALNQKILTKTPRRMIDRTAAYWQMWACKEPDDFSAIPRPVRDMYVRSQLVMRTQIDEGGAILAANDSDIQHFAGDHYSYMWPRDGALVAHALAMAGHGELGRSFFRFCDDILDERGYFLHKYNPTGTPASSWHPLLLDGEEVLPIQQDETALIVWALRQHFLKFRDVEFIKPLYQSMIVAPAKWMLEHRDHAGLPRASWDLWEERRGIHTFTVAATIGGLQAAADFCRDMGALDNASRFSEGADRMRGAMLRHMWDPESRRIARMATPRADGGYDLDWTVDASTYGLFAFDALPADHQVVAAVMDRIRERLWVKTDVGGIARYENDYYHQIEREDLDRVPGNPWVICTLWLAQYEIAKATSIDELQPALRYLRWCESRTHDSGVLAEQYHPFTGAPISVSPLTWSHATVITTVQQYLQKHRELTVDAALAAAAAAAESSSAG
ncbi:MAG: glycoside hydrolase family 15 protein [Phycisphaerales bacterium]